MMKLVLPKFVMHSMSVIWQYWRHCMHPWINRWHKMLFADNGHNSRQWHFWISAQYHFWAFEFSCM